MRAARPLREVSEVWFVSATTSNMTMLPLQCRIAALATILIPTSAFAVSDVWTGALDGDFSNPVNWLGGNAPGNPGLATGSTDIATLRGSINTAVLLPADRNLFSLNWNNNEPGLGAFVLSGSVLSTTAGGNLNLNGMWGSSAQTITSSLLLNGGLTGFISPGSGGIQLAGPITSAATTGTTTLSLRTGLGGGLTFWGGLANGGGTNLLNVTVAQSSTGTTTLGGTNTFTGGLFALGGRMLIDDTNGNAVLAATNALRVQNSRVEFRGAASGVSSETLGTLQVNEFSSSRIYVNPNGGSGNTVQVAGIGTNGAGAAGITHFELPAAAVFRTAVPLPVNSIAVNVAINNGILMIAGTPGANGYRATNLVEDATGIGFATQNANNEIVRYSGATVLTGADTSTATNNTTNYLLSSSLTRTAALPFSTLQVDTASGAVTLDMGANALNSVGGNGRGLLVTGNNDLLITGSSTVGSTTYLHNHGAGKTTLDMAMASGQTFVSAGPGLTVLTKATVADMFIVQGTTRLTLDQSVATGLLRIYGGGVMEIGADLNGGTAGDLTRAIGSASGNISFSGDSGGFGAFTTVPGGTRTVNLGGAGATLTWSSGDFIGGALVLSSPTSNATLQMQNGFNVAGGDRVFDVRNGSASIDARLLGAVTNATVNSPGGIYKRGAGTLEMTNALNSYDGGTRVAEGRLLVSGTLSGTTAVIVQSGAVFELAASNVVNDAAKVKLEGGVFATGGFSETIGSFTLAGSASLDLGSSASVLSFANSNAELWSGSLSILNWDGLTSGGGTDQLFFGNDSAGLTPDQLTLVQFINPTGFAPGAYAAEMLSTGELVAIPEPSSATVLCMGVGFLLGLSRTRRRS